MSKTQEMKTTPENPVYHQCLHVILNNVVFPRETNEAELLKKKEEKRQEILHEAEVILSTCFGSVCADLRDIGSFQAVIIDEACQVRN